MKIQKLKEVPISIFCFIAKDISNCIFIENQRENTFYAIYKDYIVEFSSFNELENEFKKKTKEYKMNNMNIIYGLDKNGNDILVIEKYGKYAWFYSEPTEEEINETAIEFQLDEKEISYLKKRIKEWKSYKRN